MSSQSGILERRRANALFPQAAPSEQALRQISRKMVRSGMFVGWFFAPMLRSQLETTRRRQRGLWVGGEAILTQSTLSFRPNSLNRSFHSQPETLEATVPLQQITRLRLRSAFLTDIIDIDTADGLLSIRCFRAKQFLRAIQKAAAICG